MKKYTGVFILLLLAIGLSSCNKLKDLADFKFDTTLSGDLDIYVEEPFVKSTADGYPFNEETYIDPLDDDSVAEYLDNIKDWAINGITVTVVSVSKSDVSFQPGTYFRITDGTNTATWTLGSDFAVINDAQIALDNSGGTYDAVRKILLNADILTITVDGESTDKDVTIILKVSIGAKVTANPL